MLTKIDIINQVAIHVTTTNIKSGNLDCILQLPLRENDKKEVVPIAPIPWVELLIKSITDTGALDLTNGVPEGKVIFVPGFGARKLPESSLRVKLDICAMDPAPDVKPTFDKRNQDFMSHCYKLEAHNDKVAADMEKVEGTDIEIKSKFKPIPDANTLMYNFVSITLPDDYNRLPGESKYVEMPKLVISTEAECGLKTAKRRLEQSVDSINGEIDKAQQQKASDELLIETLLGVLNGTEQATYIADPSEKK